MKHKKILSVITATMMLFASVQGVFGTAALAANETHDTVNLPDSDGVYWIEESDYATYQNSDDGDLAFRVGTNGTVASKTTDLVSGGNAYWAWWGGVTYSATYRVNVTAAGTYKLWYRGSDPTNGYYNTAKLKVNDNDVTSSLSKVTGTDFTVEVDSTGTKKTFACAFFTAEITLTSGVNTITYEVTEKSTSGQKYACLFDCMVIAPASYDWSNPSISTQPAGESSNIISPDFDGVYWIEESDYDSYENAADGDLAARVGTNGTAAANTTDLVSGGDAYWAWWGGATYSATYKVDVSEAGTYKIWYRGSDPTNAYYDKVKLKVNGTDITSSFSKVIGTDFTVIVDPSGTRKSFACAFFLAEVTLSSGENIISYEITEKSTSGQKYAGLFDCMVIAPSSYEWNNPSVSTRPAENGEPSETEAPVDTSIHFDDVTGVAWIEEKDYDTDSNSNDGDLAARVGTNGTAAADTTELVSGGDAYWAWWGGTTYSASYEVTAPEAGTYKLWYRGSDPTNAYYDTVKLKVNGADITSSLSKVTGTDFTVIVDPSGMKKTFACAFFTAAITLNSGVNTITYEITEKSTGANNKYAGLFDCLVLAPATYEWTSPSTDTLPVGIQMNKYGWIEGENYTRVNDSSKFQSRAGNPATDLSDGRLLSLSTQSTAPADGYYAEYDLQVAASGTYDILVRTNHTGGGDNNSPVILSVDGEVKTHTELDFEGWFESNGSDQFTIGWSRITMPLTAGTHTLRWALNQMTSTRYYGVIDAVAFMPSAMGFAPKSGNVEGTHAEYELSALLCDYDPTNLDSDVVLPSETINGHAVTWKSSDTSVISDTGVIVRDEFYNKTAVLTATISGYSKDFKIRIANASAYKIENFSVTGELGAGNVVTASADVTSLVSDEKSVVLIVAHYGSDHSLKGFNYETYSLTQNSVTNAEVSLTLQNYTSGDYVKAFVWNDLDNINALTGSISK
ncbi:MAG: hypothetical protein IJH94_03950 [Clostridia bacterium]|nr:hypothetical protein [Clostridia bacterium]